MQIIYISERDKPRRLKQFCQWLIRTVLATAMHIKAFYDCAMVTLDQFGEYRLGGEILIPPLVFLLTYYLVKEVQQYATDRRANRRRASQFCHHTDFKLVGVEP